MGIGSFSDWISTKVSSFALAILAAPNSSNSTGTSILPSTFSTLAGIRQIFWL